MLMDFVKKVFASGPLPMAALLFLASNFLFLIWNPFGNVDPDALPVARNWIWWATHEYMDKKEAPRVVALGSSAVMHPLWHHEADFRQQTVDFVADHRSRFLEKVIAENTNVKDVECFNFALPGGMVSDDYMVVRAMFKPDKKPKMVIIGLTPRDLIDNRFNCAGSSKHFQYLSRFADVRNMLDLSMPQWWQRIGYLISESIYFTSKAQAAQVIVSENIRQLATPFSKFLVSSPLDKKEGEGGLGGKQMAIHQNLVEKGFWIAKPNAETRYVPDMADLKKRYKGSNNATFENQRQWLELCLKACNERGIKVVLVNMPNNPLALAALPAGVYQRHVLCLKQLAQKSGALFVNADLRDRFSEKDFTDCFHLSAAGGKKAFETVGEAIGRDSSAISSLLHSSTSIAGKNAGGM